MEESTYISEDMLTVLWHSCFELGKRVCFDPVLLSAENLAFYLEQLQILTEIGYKQ